MNILTSGIPIWWFIAAGTLLLLSILTAGWSLIQSNVLRSRLFVLRDRPGHWSSEYRKHYPPGRLMRFSGVLERYAERREAAVLGITGIDELWLRRLADRGSGRDMRRVLRFFPDRGLYVCFLASLKKPRLARILATWLKEHRDFHVLRRVALAGSGELFDGRKALEQFREQVPELREMTGDPEWRCRAFALQMLVHDEDDERSSRASWDAFTDPAAPIRRIAIRDLRTGDRDRLFGTLSRMILDDPDEEVRREAHRRLIREFRDRYAPTEEKLDGIRTLHLLGLLAPGVEEDEAFAFRFLEDADLEKRFLAAAYLQRNGSLDQLFSRVQEGDRAGTERAYRLLSRSAEVNVSDYLTILSETQNRGTLMIGARILRERGDRSLIAVLAGRVFERPLLETADSELYQEVLDTVRERGNEDAYRELMQEIVRRREDGVQAAKLLGAVPPQAAHLFSGLLLDLLVDPSFPAWEPLERTLRAVPLGMILDRMYGIVTATGDRYPRVVRVRALRLLAGSGADYCIQHVLEHLPLCTNEEARELSAALASVGDGRLDGKVRFLLDSGDAAVRASLLISLPVEKKRQYLKDIREALRDADPDVRIAAVRSLVDLGDARSIGQAADLLRDPVERVRVEAANALGRFGTEASLETLIRAVDDPNEVEPVRSAAYAGLGESSLPRSVDILVDRLEAGEPLADEITDALSRKQDRAGLERLIERYKDADRKLREALGQGFRKMGPDGEDVLVRLLREDIPSLKPHIAEVLETTGHVESRIRKLANRDPAIRRESAEILSLIDTPAAFRGIVMAARDPDEEVRIRVVRSLEKLAGDEGKGILKELEQDPDKRVRKYTLWAMERVRAKAL